MLPIYSFWGMSGFEPRELPYTTCIQAGALFFYMALYLLYKVLKDKCMTLHSTWCHMKGRVVLSFHVGVTSTINLWLRHTALHCWPLLCLFIVFEGCLDSNRECCRIQAGALFYYMALYLLYRVLKDKCMTLHSTWCHVKRHGRVGHSFRDHLNYKPMTSSHGSTL